MFKKIGMALLVVGLTVGGGTEAFGKGPGGSGGKGGGSGGGKGGGGGGKSAGGSAGKSGGGNQGASRGPAGGGQKAASAPSGGQKAAPSAPAKSLQPNCAPGSHPTPQPAPKTTGQKAWDIVKTAPKSATPLGALKSLLTPTKLGDGTVCTPDKKK